MREQGTKFLWCAENLIMEAMNLNERRELVESVYCDLLLPK
jgi:hypothetical protein